MAPAPRSEAARKKDADKKTVDGLPVLSFRSLLEHMGTMAKNRVRPAADSSLEFFEVTQATPVQRRAFELLGVAM